jgi:hypothetical protein
MNLVSAIDFHLLDVRSRTIHGRRRGLLEFVYFGIQNARACRFVGLFDLRIEHHPPYWMAATIAIGLAENIGGFRACGATRTSPVPGLASMSESGAPRRCW